MRGATGKGFWGDLSGLPTIAAGSIRGGVQVTRLGNAFGVGGIGALIREKTGDKIQVEFSAVA